MGKSKKPKGMSKYAKKRHLGIRGNGWVSGTPRARLWRGHENFASLRDSNEDHFHRPFVNQIELPSGKKAHVIGLADGNIQFL